MATGKARSTAERQKTAARSRTAAAKRAAATVRAPKPPWYRRLFHNVGVPEMVIAGVSTAVTVWAWLAFVVTQPQDYTSFVVVYGIAIIGGSIVHFALPFIFSWRGMFTSRLGRSTAKADGADDNEDTTGGSGVVYWGPVVVSVIAFLIVTPPNTPTGEPDFASIYQVIFLMGMLGLIGVGLGVLVIMLIAMPIMWLVAAALPDHRPKEVIARDPMSRAQYAAGGGILLLIVTFAVGMHFVGDGGGSPHSSYGRMGLQFINLVTLRGNLIAVAVVVVCVIGIVLLVIVNNRAAAKRRMRALAAPNRPPGR